MAHNGGTPQFRVGTTAGNRFAWDGADLSLVSNNLTIGASGVTLALKTTGGDTTSMYRFAASGAITGDHIGIEGIQASGGGINTRVIGINNTITSAAATARVFLGATDSSSKLASISISSQDISGITSLIEMGADAITISGVTTITGALEANGGITVDTNKFTVADGTGNTVIAGTLAAGQTTITTATDGVVVLDYTGANGTNTQMAYYRSGVLQGSISTTAASTSFNTTSDGRLKHHWRTPSYSLATLMQVVIGDYDWIATGQPGTGVEAQQLHTLYPWAVTQGKDETPWQVDYGKLTPLIAVSVQELKHEVDALRAELAAIKGAQGGRA
jgi:hypothetical protein